MSERFGLSARDRPDERTWRPVCPQVGHERLIDLEDIDGERRK
jgi:hypothetical protein